MGKGQRSRNNQAVKAAAGTVKKPEKNGKLKGVIIAVAVVVVLLALIALTIFNNAKDQGWFEGNEVVMSSENFSVTDGMFSFFFREVYTNTYNTYYSFLGDNVTSYIDTSKSLKEQEYPGGGDYSTWYDYILAQTKLAVGEYLTFCEEARAAGISLDKSDRDEINSEVNDIKSAAKTYGYNSADDYIRASFGIGVNSAKIKKALEIEHLAVKYRTKITDEVDVSDEAIEAVYNEDTNAYDKVTYLTYAFKADDLLPDEETADSDTDAETEAETGDENAEAEAQAIEDAIAKIKTYAEELAAKTSEEEFKAYVQKYAIDVLGQDEHTAEHTGESALKTGSYSESSDAMVWAFSAKAGESKIIESEDGKTVTVYVLVGEKARDDNDGYRTTRHVLFGKDDYDDDGAKAKEVYDKWVSEGATEDGIASLAGEYSTDAGSKEKGGLYQNVYKGQFVEPFNTWLFEEGRKEGDHDLIETEYGWHIVYFISAGEPQWKTSIRNKLTSDAYNAAKDAAAEKYEVVIKADKINVNA
ncbi:MAG: peptidylprolyl isomerase [Clostridia bacterium]|nr:peptidylprolyl isomerase [Clostridia bacterium]